MAPMDHAVHTLSRRRGLNFKLMPRKFANEDFESLYQQYVLRTQLSSLLQASLTYFALTLCLATLSFIHRQKHTVPSVLGICYIGLSFGFLLAFLLLLRFRRKLNVISVLRYILLLLFLAFCLISLPIVAQFLPSYEPMMIFSGLSDGVWQQLVSIFVVYAMLSVNMFYSVCFGLLMSVSHMITSGVMAKDEFVWQQLMANGLSFLWINVVGIYLQWIAEVIQRKDFLAARSCIEAQLQAQAESEKMKRLLCCAMPDQLATSMVAEVSHSQLDQHLQTLNISEHTNVSILFADLVGFSALTLHCAAQDLVLLLNELFGRFDELAKENGCSRVKLLGDGYFCVGGLGGTMDTRTAAHAKCCIEIGLDMIDTIQSIVKATEIKLGLRVGVHTGHVFAAISGTRKWQFDLYGTDVVIAKCLENTTVAGKIHISEVTLKELSNAFEVEPGPGCFLNSQKLKTYFIVPPCSRPKLEFDAGLKLYDSLGKRGSKRLSFLRLLQSFKFQSDVPNNSSTSPDDFAVHGGYQTMASSPMVASSDGPKKPFRKRVGASSGCGNISNTSARITRCLSQAILSNTAVQKKDPLIHWLTLKFKDRETEKKYNEEANKYFLHGSLIAHFSIVVFGCFILIVLSRVLISVLLVAASIVWISVLVSAQLLYKLKFFAYNVSETFFGQLLISLTTLALILFVNLISAFMCPVDIENARLLQFCYSPQYILVSCVMCLITLSVYIKLFTVIKLALLVIVGLLYIAQMLISHHSLLQGYANSHSSDFPAEQANVVAVFALIALVFLLCRKLEWLLRLSHTRKADTLKQKAELFQLENNNQKILANLLPTHVARHFVDKDFLSIVDLYYQVYSSVGVMFATILNYCGHNSGSDICSTCDRIHCYKLLIETIHELDSLFQEEPFRNIEKLKTIGPTYVIVSGLAPELSSEDGNATAVHLFRLLEFAFAMQQRLELINAATCEHLQLRIAINIGPVLAGIAGGRTPQYDVWGNTVNTACKLETTGEPGRILVSEDVFLALRMKPCFSFQDRKAEAVAATAEEDHYSVPEKVKKTTYFVTKISCRSNSDNCSGGGSVSRTLSTPVSRLAPPNRSPFLSTRERNALLYASSSPIQRNSGIFSFLPQSQSTLHEETETEDLSALEDVEQQHSDEPGFMAAITASELNSVGASYRETMGGAELSFVDSDILSDSDDDQREEYVKEASPLIDKAAMNYNENYSGFCRDRIRPDNCLKQCLTAGTENSLMLSQFGSFCNTQTSEDDANLRAVSCSPVEQEIDALNWAVSPDNNDGLCNEFLMPESMVCAIVFKASDCEEDNVTQQDRDLRVLREDLAKEDNIEENGIMYASNNSSKLGQSLSVIASGDNRYCSGRRRRRKLKKSTAENGHLKSGSSSENESASSKRTAVNGGKPFDLMKPETRSKAAAVSNKSPITKSAPFQFAPGNSAPAVNGLNHQDYNDTSSEVEQINGGLAPFWSCNTQQLYNDAFSNGYHTQQYIFHANMVQNDLNGQQVNGYGEQPAKWYKNNPLCDFNGQLQLEKELALAEIEDTKNAIDEVRRVISECKSQLENTAYIVATSDSHHLSSKPPLLQQQQQQRYYFNNGRYCQQQPMVEPVCAFEPLSESTSPLSESIGSPLYRPFPLLEEPLLFSDPPPDPIHNGNGSRSLQDPPAATKAIGYCYANSINSPMQHQQRFISETEYENLESEYHVSASEFEGYHHNNVVLSCSPETGFLRKTRLLVPGCNLSFESVKGVDLRMSQDDSVIGLTSSQNKLRREGLSTLDYLGLDTGHDADIDSLDSRCSSRLFEDQHGALFRPIKHRKKDMFCGAEAGLQKKPSTAVTSKAKLVESEPISDIEIDYFNKDEIQDLKRVTADIKKSFGEFKLASYSDLDSDFDC